ncbi:SPOC like C-terminal domain-containing protein [Paraphysoderma sedebokerense]|nr:SPOC like C-terminal domain-containing protein [Paraphysoderma sedebokerense]
MPWDPPDDFELEDEFDDSQETLVPARDGIIFAIDCNSSMFEPLKEQFSDDVNGDAELSTPFQMAIHAVKDTMESKIIASEDDKIGVIFFNTVNFQNQPSKPHYYTYVELDTPSAETILNLQHLITTDGVDEFKNEIGCLDVEGKERAILGDVVTEAMSAFQGSKAKLGVKRIFLITNEDDPHKSTPEFRNSSIARAADAREMEVFFEPFFINRPGKAFDPYTFYVDFVGIEEESTLPDFFAGSTRWNEFSTRVRRRQVKKRSLFRIPFRIGEIDIGVKGYNMFAIQRLPKHTYLHSRTNKPAVVKTTYVCEDTGKYVNVHKESDVEYFYYYGGKRIIFKISEVKKMRSFGEGHIELLGFKNIDELSMHHNLTHSTFLYPDETQYKGSNRTFASLVDSLIRKRKYALCRFHPRRVGTPHLAALIPQLEMEDDAGQVQPTGLHVITFPFADDMRHFGELPEDHKAPDPLSTQFSVILQKLHIPNFSLQNYPNVALENHFEYLAAKALDREPALIPDKSMPNYDDIGAKVGEDIVKLKELIPEFIPPEKPLKKRKAQDEAVSSKKVKANLDSSNSDFEAKIRELYNSGQLSTLTVPLLKEALGHFELKVSGKKADLIARLEDHFGG